MIDRLQLLGATLILLADLVVDSKKVLNYKYYKTMSLKPVMSDLDQRRQFRNINHLITFFLFANILIFFISINKLKDLGIKVEKLFRLLLVVSCS